MRWWRWKAGGSISTSIHRRSDLLGHEVGIGSVRGTPSVQVRVGGGVRFRLDWSWYCLVLPEIQGPGHAVHKFQSGASEPPARPECLDGPRDRYAPSGVFGFCVPRGVG